MFIVDVSVKKHQIDRCKSEWDGFDKKKELSWEIYLSTGQKNTKAIDDALQYEEQGFEAYRRCYGEAIKSDRMFSLLTRQVQSVIDRLRNSTEDPSGR